ncbi:MAG: hypothetical protein RL386_453 [Bacteroidota bacterium]|jgi:hypothetical protein
MLFDDETDKPDSNIATGLSLPTILFKQTKLIKYIQPFPGQKFIVAISTYYRLTLRKINSHV